MSAIWLEVVALPMFFSSVGWGSLPLPKALQKVLTLWEVTAGSVGSSGGNPSNVH